MVSGPRYWRRTHVRDGWPGAQEEWEECCALSARGTVVVTLWNRLNDKLGNRLDCLYVWNSFIRIQDIMQWDYFHFLSRLDFSYFPGGSSQLLQSAWHDVMRLLSFPLYCKSVRMQFPLRHLPLSRSCVIKVQHNANTHIPSLPGVIQGGYKHVTHDKG